MGFAGAAHPDVRATAISVTFVCRRHGGMWRCQWMCCVCPASSAPKAARPPPTSSPRCARKSRLVVNIANISARSFATADCPLPLSVTSKSHDRHSCQVRPHGLTSTASAGVLKPGSAQADADQADEAAVGRLRCLFAAAHQRLAGGDLGVLPAPTGHCAYLPARTGSVAHCVSRQAYQFT